MKELPPIPTAFTSAVASREFVVLIDEVSTSVLFEVGIPTQDVATVEGFDWRCPIRIMEGDLLRERQAFGVDSFQALQLGLRIVEDEATLMSSAEDSTVLLFGAVFEPNG